MNRGDNTSYTHIPQNGNKLRELRGQTTQNHIAEQLTTILKPIMARGFVIQQPDISRLESEATVLDVPRLLAYAHHFNCEVGDLLKPHLKALYKSALCWREFNTDEEVDNYLCRLESNGRLLAHSIFPSSFFSSTRQCERFTQLNQPDYPNTEIYTLDAFLNFVFSPIGFYSIAEKIAILKRYVEYFRGSAVKHLRFFSRTQFPNNSRFPNLELLRDKATVVTLAPMMKQCAGDVFIEIQGKEICEKVYEFYHFQVNKLDDDVAFVKVAIQALEKMQEGSSVEMAILFFYNSIKSRDEEEAAEVRYNFSPDIQEWLQRQLTA